MIDIRYFLGHPVGIPANVYVVPFKPFSSGEIAFFGNSEWIKGTYPYMKYFIQLIGHNPMFMKEGEIFIDRKDNEWQPSWKIDDVLFIRDDEQMPLQDLITIALTRIKDENYAVVNMQLFRPGQMQRSRERELQHAQSAMLMLMAFDQFQKDFPDVNLTVNVNFHALQSSGYQSFQIRKIPFLGIK